MSEKQKAQLGLHVEAAVEVRRILWEQWDPIGVSKEAGAFGEYDSYAGGVVALVVNGRTDRDLAEHLGIIERSSMGLRGTPIEHRLAVAQSVRRALAALGIA